MNTIQIRRLFTVFRQKKFSEKYFEKLIQETQPNKVPDIPLIKYRVKINMAGIDSSNNALRKSGLVHSCRMSKGTGRRFNPIRTKQFINFITNISPLYLAYINHKIKTETLWSPPKLHRKV